MPTIPQWQSDCGPHIPYKIHCGILCIQLRPTITQKCSWGWFDS